MSRRPARLLSRNLTDRERLQGPRDAETMATRDRLAAACLAEGKIKDAISQYKRALSDREKVLGRDHPDTIATTANLAAAYQAAGRMPAAMQLSEQCCADSERVLGPDHADTLARLANLAYLYYAVGRVGDAVALLRDIAMRCERVLPTGDPLTQAVHQSLLNIGDGLMPSASAMPAEAGIFRVCHLLRRIDRYYRAGASLVPGLPQDHRRSEPGQVWVTAHTRIPVGR